MLQICFLIFYNVPVCSLWNLQLTKSKTEKGEKLASFVGTAQNTIFLKNLNPRIARKFRSALFLILTQACRKFAS